MRYINKINNVKKIQVNEKSAQTSHTEQVPQAEHVPYGMGRKHTAWMPPSIEQWKALYEAADEIKQLKPWEKLWDTSLFALQMPDREEPIFFSVMGRNHECFGISIYPDYDSMSCYYRLMKSRKGEPLFVTLSYQNCVVCYFGCRDELTGKDYRIIKQLGLKYRGKDQWTYFRTFRTGYYPWQPDAKECKFLIPALQQFIEAYKAFDEGKIHVDFESGQMLLRFYGAERGEWNMAACEEMPVFKSKPPVEITDELFIARMKRERMTQTVISLDIIYIPYSVQQSNAAIPFYPRVLLLLDETNEKILIQRILDVNDDETRQIHDALSSYILKNGRPYSLHVRDDRIGCIVEDLCDKIGVKLVQNMGLPMMDDLATSLVEYMAGI